jgi:hypothetical protein
MISLDFGDIQLKMRNTDGRTSVFDPIRRKWLVLTPEEHVRQYVLQLLIRKLKYPMALLAVEKTIQVGTMSKRYDIVVHDREHKPWMLVECKKPEVPITEETLIQLLSYHSVVQCRYWLLTNGHQAFCADAGNLSNISWLTDLPDFSKNQI